MYDAAIFWDWISFAVRWLHVITAMAWIGSSFYFIALDLGLNRNFGASWPMRYGRGWAISRHIAWVTFHSFLHLGLSLCLFFAPRLGKQKRNRS